MSWTRLIVSASLCVSLSAQAAVVFSDDFDASASGLNVTPTGWTVTAGTVDVVGAGFCVGGLCVDLDGSTFDAGVLSIDLALVGGTSYVLAFDLSGNRRGGTDDVTVSFGSASLFFDDLPAGAPYATQTLAFTPAVGGTYTISFSNAGGDNVGALIDNVVVRSVDQTAVPEPGTAALVALGAIGFAGLRRRLQRPRG